MNNSEFDPQSRHILREIMKSRRDVRGNHFTDQPVSDEIIRDLLDAAMTAPSVGLSEPWEFIVIRDIDKRKQIVECFNQSNRTAAEQFRDKKQQEYKELKLEGILESAVNLAVFYNPPTQPVLGQNSMKDVGRYSVVCAIQNLWLMARAHNIGLGWVSILDQDSVKRILDTPLDFELIGYLCLGYVKQFLNTPELEHLKWKQRRCSSSAIHFDTFTS